MNAGERNLIAASSANASPSLRRELCAPASKRKRLSQNARLSLGNVCASEASSDRREPPQRVRDRQHLLGRIRGVENSALRQL